MWEIHLREIKHNSNNSLDRKHTRINFLNSSWYHDFLTIQNKLSKYPYISSRSLRAWEESYRCPSLLMNSSKGFSETKYFKDHMIVTNACIDSMASSITLHEENPVLQEQAEAFLSSSDFSCMDSFNILSRFEDSSEFLSLGLISVNSTIFRFSNPSFAKIYQHLPLFGGYFFLATDSPLS